MGGFATLAQIGVFRSCLWGVTDKEFSRLHISLKQLNSLCLRRHFGSAPAQYASLSVSRKMEVTGCNRQGDLRRLNWWSVECLEHLHVYEYSYVPGLKDTLQVLQTSACACSGNARTGLSFERARTYAASGPHLPPPLCRRQPTALEGGRPHARLGPATSV